MSDRFEPPRWKQAKPLSDYATKLLSPVTERQAGMTLDLLASWDEIAGPEHAARTRPEGLKWARQSEDGFEPATLVVACEGAHAVFFQHETGPLVERLNHFFGFHAVDRVQIVQRSVRRPSKAKRAPRERPEAVAAVTSRVGGVEHDGLRAALDRLGRGVFRDGSDG